MESIHHSGDFSNLEIEIGFKYSNLNLGFKQGINKIN
jgi:hypothetical protein